MKNCSTCKLTKEIDQYHFKKSENIYQSMCKDCFSKYCMKRWADRKLKAIEYKGGCCSSCGYKRYTGALEFHHLLPKEKEFDWSKMRLISMDKMLKELDKCILLCLNCHKEAHALSD